MPTLRVLSGFDFLLPDASKKAAAVTVPCTEHAPRDARAEVSMASDGWEVQSTQDVSSVAAYVSDVCVCFVQAKCPVVSLHYCGSVLFGACA